MAPKSSVQTIVMVILNSVPFLEIPKSRSYVFSQATQCGTHSEFLREIKLIHVRVQGVIVARSHDQMLPVVWLPMLFLPTNSTTVSSFAEVSVRFKMFEKK